MSENIPYSTSGCAGEMPRRDQSSGSEHQSSRRESGHSRIKNSEIPGKMARPRLAASVQVCLDKGVFSMIMDIISIEIGSRLDKGMAGVLDRDWNTP